MTVVPGAVGAWRRAALDAVGGYPENTLAEDQDLTIAIQQAGWCVTFDPEAVAWTEALGDHLGLAMEEFDFEADELADIVGDHWAGVLWGCAFEDLLTRTIEPGDRNI